MPQISEQLKPCPAGHPAEHDSDGLGNFQIICTKCSWSCSWFDTMEEAIEAWNLRATPEQPQAQEKGAQSITDMPEKIYVWFNGKDTRQGFYDAVGGRNNGYEYVRHDIREAQTPTQTGGEANERNAIEELESNIGYYDMPEHEDTLPVSGWALCELIDEVKRWRETHKAGEFSPDYCAAREALTEHLAHCKAALTEPREWTEELRKDLSDAYKVVLACDSEHRLLPDHACRECVPHGEMLIEGFKCVKHKALAASGVLTLKEGE